MDPVTHHDRLESLVIIGAAWSIDGERAYTIKSESTLHYFVRVMVSVVLYRY